MRRVATEKVDFFKDLDICVCVWVSCRSVYVFACVHVVVGAHAHF